jgi:GPH family glycoside/pentoside/hexuronide:cation symporter
MGVMAMGMGFLGIPFFSFLSHRLGKLRALNCVLCSAIAAFMATWWLYTPRIVWLQLFASGSIAFTGVGFWLLMGSIGADVMDFDELEGGRRREGAFCACSSWINKVGMAGGAGVSFFILQWVGFDSNLAIQDPHTIFMMRFLLIAIPLVGLVLSAIALRRFPLTQEKMADIRRALEARRGSV